jgi:PH (Pleckstrin Homology) domain-containing protein
MAMISRSTLDKQLKQIHFNIQGWGRSEAQELCNVLMPSEEIDECVNGYYEAGFALLVATKDRLLLVDKKPLNYLTIEDLRFDMINEFDYNHRLIGAEIKISAGAKTLHFRSLNKTRLRRLIGYVQYRMTEIKKLQQSHQESQKSHLERMNQQLQMFLAIQQYQQQMVQHQTAGGSQPVAMPTSSNPSLLSAAASTAPSEQSSSRLISPAQLGIAAMKRVVPVIGAYTRLPLMSQRYRFSNSKVSTGAPTPLQPTY